MVKKETTKDRLQTVVWLLIGTVVCGTLIAGPIAWVAHSPNIFLPIAVVATMPLWIGAVLTAITKIPFDACIKCGAMFMGALLLASYLLDKIGVIEPVASVWVVASVIAILCVLLYYFVRLKPAIDEEKELLKWIEEHPELANDMELK